MQNTPDPNRLAADNAEIKNDRGEPVSTGVGLANIRDRLAQAYGDDQKFEIQDAAEGGFAVLIELPFEKRETSAPAARPAPRLAAAG